MKQRRVEEALGRGPPHEGKVAGSEASWEGTQEKASMERQRHAWASFTWMERAERSRKQKRLGD